MNNEKVQKSIKRLKAFEPADEPYYLCYSGRKDSDCVRILADLSDVITEALNMIENAVEKQIPKKPTTETINRGISVSGEYDIDFNYLCPNCNTVVGEYEADYVFCKFCPNCGQALDWRKINEC